MIRFVPIMLLGALAACGPMDPNVAADRCEERARGAQGPQADLTVGANSRTGGFGSASVSISSDFIRGLDPEQVYQRCVLELTGENPVRPPVLRNL